MTDLNKTNKNMGFEINDADSKWHVRIYGTRGSLPTPGAKTLVYGGNTSCVSVQVKDELIIFDAGSGIAELGAQLVKDGKSSIQKIHLFLSHLHLDHIIGLLCFAPLFDPDVEVTIYSGLHQGKPVKDWLMTVFAPPFWPVTLENVPAKVSYVTLKENEPKNFAPGLRILSMIANHPDESLMYRMEALDGQISDEPKSGKSLVYGLDCELTDDIKASVLKFAENADLMVCDATYLPSDLESHAGWGHSSWKSWTDFVCSAKVQKCLMMHYSLDYADEILSEEEQIAKEACGDPIVFAKEDIEIIL